MGEHSGDVGEVLRENNLPLKPFDDASRSNDDSRLYNGMKQLNRK